MKVSFSVTQASINTEELYWFFFTIYGRLLTLLVSVFVTIGVFYKKNDLLYDNGFVYIALNLFGLWVVVVLVCVVSLVLMMHVGTASGYNSRWEKIRFNRVLYFDDESNELCVSEDGKKRKYKLSPARIDSRFDRAIIFLKNRIFVLSRVEIYEGNFSEFIDKLTEVLRQK